MDDPFPYRRQDEQTGALPSRVQARLEQIEPDDDAGAAPLRAADLPERGEWVARARVTENRTDELEQQLDRLRRQLDQVFDELEDRLAECETRVGVAEARASVAEARASVAETRAADAEARANEAHHRVDVLLAELGRLLSTDAGGAVTPRPDLRGALDQLRERLDVG